MSDKPRSILERDWPYPGDTDGQSLMTDDIAALIEEARAIIPYWPTHAELVERLIAELSRLTTQSLPEEIARLIERLDAYIPPKWSREEALHDDIRRALRALAQENEKLRKERDERLQAKAERIAELEAEVHRLQNNEVNDCDLLGMHERRIAELEAERGAIQAKTIEECAQVADGWDFGKPIAKDIRALAQTDESKTESGE